MKNGTVYGKRIRYLFEKLRAEGDEVVYPESREPLVQLLHSMLSLDTTSANAIRAMSGLTDAMIDLNEVRVSAPSEIAQIIDEFIPDSLVVATRCHDALNDVFRKTNSMSLNVLSGIGRRDARQFLDELAGVDPHSAAAVMLWSLGGHAVPVDNRLLKILKRADFVDKDASVAEVQAFLERHIQAEEGREFCARTQKLTANYALKVSSTKGIPAGPAQPETRPKPSPTASKGAASKEAKAKSGR